MWERLISAVFGLKRRGADYGDKSGGKNDAVQTDGRESEWWSLEIKHGKRITFQLLLDACRKLLQPLQGLGIATVERFDLAAQASQVGLQLFQGHVSTGYRGLIRWYRFPAPTGP